MEALPSVAREGFTTSTAGDGSISSVSALMVGVNGTVGKELIKASPESLP